MSTGYKPVDKVKGAEAEEFSDEECAIVVADAKVVPFDGLEAAGSGSPPGDDDHSGGFRRVRVTAPCDLPPKYKLAVTTGDGETFDVIIPEKGVYRGQEFEADKWQPKRIEGVFGDDIFNCCGEGRWFAIAACCTGLAFGAIMEKLQLTWCANHSAASPRPKTTFATVAVLWSLFVFTYVAFHLVPITSEPQSQAELPSSNLSVVFLALAPVQFALIIYFIVIQTKTRMAFRFAYKIPGSCCIDCLVSSYCGCCSALQMYRHMKRSGDRPVRFSDQGAVPAEIV